MEPYNPTGQAGTNVINSLGQTIGGYDSAGALAKFMPPTSTVTANSLVNPPLPAVIPQPKIPTLPEQFIQNLQPVIKQSQQGLIEANTREAQQRDDVLNRLLGVQDQNSQATFDNKFNKLGGEDFIRQFTDANTRLAQLEGVFRTGSQKVSSAPGQSQVFEGLQLNEVSRQKAVEVGNQAILVQALQGNIETARQIALDTTRFASEDRAAKLENLLSQFDALNGIVQGQEKQLVDNARIKAEQEYDQLKRTQATIDTAIQSGGASVEEMQKLASPSISDQEKMGLAQQIISRTVGQERTFDQNYKAQQLASSKYTLGSDAYGNPLIFNTKDGTVKSVNVDALDQTAQDGTTGGQCGVFAHTICDFPAVGNSLSEKQATVDKNGVTADQWRQEGANPGDVLIFNLGKYGHVSVVTQDNGDGTVTVKDSNFGLDEKIQTRIVSKDDPTLYGAIRGTLKDKFTSPANNGPLYSDVPIKLRPQVEKIASNFDNEAIVKRYNTIAGDYGLTQSIDNNTKNPADQQAIIYAFAKAMDPDSVVREGEYATVQKYSSSWAKTFGFNAQRVIDEGAPILTPTAIAKIKETIESKYSVINNQYQNLYNDYGRRINAITGKSNGTAYLPNYAQGVYSQGSESSAEDAYIQSILGGASSTPTAAPQASNSQPSNLQVPTAGLFATPFAPIAAAASYIKSLFKR